jgi:hypothetical protein
MTVSITEIDAHEQPSDELRGEWKAYAKAEQKDIDLSKIDDLKSPETASQFVVAGTIPADRLNKAFSQLCHGDDSKFQVEHDAPIYYHRLVPGLFTFPFWCDYWRFG